MAELTDEDRTLQSLYGQQGNGIRWANSTPESRRQQTAPARAKADEGTLRKFEQEVDPRGELDPAERRFRAKHARRARMAELSLIAVKARRELRQLAGADAETAA